jgi:hypothetical protein
MQMPPSMIATPARNSLGRIAPRIGTADEQRTAQEAEHLDPEEERRKLGLESQRQGAAHYQVAETDGHEHGEHAEHDLGHRLQQMQLDLPTVSRRSHAGLEQHDAVADGDRRQQVEQRDDRRLPQRIDLHTHHHQQRTERGLVHHRQHGAERDEEEQHLV